MKDDCYIIEDRLAQYLQGGLDGESLSKIESHLEGCDACRKRYAFAGSILDSCDDRDFEADSGLVTKIRSTLFSTDVVLGEQSLSLPGVWFRVAAAIIVCVVFVGLGIGTGQSFQAKIVQEEAVIEVFTSSIDHSELTSLSPLLSSALENKPDNHE